MEISSRIIEKLKNEPNKTAKIRQLNGNVTNLYFIKEDTFWSDNLNKLKNDGYSFRIFDILYKESFRFENRKIPKGNARAYKLGNGKCNKDTIAGIFGYQYLGAKTGDSILEPTHVFAAILEWAGVAKNIRGYIQFY